MDIRFYESGGIWQFIDEANVLQGLALGTLIYSLKENRLSIREITQPDWLFYDIEITKILKSETPDDYYTSVADFFNINELFFKRLVPLTTYDGTPVDIQNPLPTNGDSVYCKDIDVARCNLYGFSGSPCDLFNDSHSIIKDITDVANKKILIYFNRTIAVQSLGIGNNELGSHPEAPNFSNVKITAINSGGVEVALVDQSTNDTKYTSKPYSFVNTLMNAIKVEFTTTDPVGLTNFTIQKTSFTATRIISNIKSPLGRVSEYLKNGTNTNMNVDGSVTPVDFVYENTSDVDEEFERILLSLIDGAQEFRSTNFGALNALLDGVEIIFSIQGVEKIEEVWQTNADISETCYDFTNPFKDGAYVGRWTFSKDTNSPIYLQPGDKLIVRINDDLRNLTSLRMRLKGDKV